MNIPGKTVLITGSTDGLGHCIASRHIASGLAAAGLKRSAEIH
jgi:NADP-dependent 3-hydroxy acid dehydrogenase YdfG